MKAHKGGNGEGANAAPQSHRHTKRHTFPPCKQKVAPSNNNNNNNNERQEVRSIDRLIARS